MGNIEEVMIICGTYNDKGSTCAIADEGSICKERITLVQSRTMSGKKSCLLAAKRLRQLAKRFEKLAKKKNPKSLKNQIKINGMEMDGK